jgi:hypothetical protein
MSKLPPLQRELADGSKDGADRAIEHDASLSSAPLYGASAVFADVIRACRSRAAGDDGQLTSARGLHLCSPTLGALGHELVPFCARFGRDPLDPVDVCYSWA